MADFFLDTLEAIRLIPQRPQTQVSLIEQLAVLQHAANRLGLYDAADFVQRELAKQNFSLDNQQ